MHFFKYLRLRRNGGQMPDGRLCALRVRSAIPAKSFAPKPKSRFKYPESLVTYI